MRNVVLAALLICTLLGGTPPVAGAAPGPDGFANVPWGASGSQVDEAMKSRGFSVDRQFTFPGMKSYRGSLDGKPGRLEFLFERDAFYQGVFVYFSEFGATAAKAVGGVFKEKIEAKYGPAQPGTSGYARGTASVWEGLRAPDTGEMVRIELIVNLDGTRPFVAIVYKNEDLRRRLLAEEKNGL
jgi:hypothetical protein